MADVVVTVPMRLWEEWVEEGGLPGAAWDGSEYHFWLSRLPAINWGERVYVVAGGRLRGYAPLQRREANCRLNPGKSCLVRSVGAVAVTVGQPIKGFRGFRYRWWDRAEESPFLDWKQLDASH